MVAAAVVSQADPVSPPLPGDPLAGRSIELPPDVDISLVRKAGIFNGLRPEQIDAFLSIGTPRVFRPGEALVREAEMDTEMYLLLRGKVDILRKLTIPLVKGASESQKSIVNLESPRMGIIPLGAPNMLAGGGRSATVLALEPCDTLMITKHDFEALCDHDSRVGYVMARNIAATLARDLGTTNAQVLKLTTALTFALQRRN